VRLGAVDGLLDACYGKLPPLLEEAGCLLKGPGAVGVEAEGGPAGGEPASQGLDDGWEGLLVVRQADLELEVAQAEEALSAEAAQHLAGLAAGEHAAVADAVGAAGWAEVGQAHPTGGFVEASSEVAAVGVQQGQLDAGTGGGDGLCGWVGERQVAEGFHGGGQGAGVEVHEQGHEAGLDGVEDGLGGFAGDIGAGVCFAVADGAVGQLGFDDDGLGYGSLAGRVGEADLHGNVEVVERNLTDGSGHGVWTLSLRRSRTAGGPRFGDCMRSGAGRKRKGGCRRAEAAARSAWRLGRSGYGDVASAGWGGYEWGPVG
jgi:hypothetical protein